MPLAKNVNLTELAEITYGFVGADLSSLCKEAAMNVLRRVLPELRLEEEEAIPAELLEKLKVTKKDFRESLRVVRPSALREVLIEIPNVKWEDVGGLEEVKQQLNEAVEWPLKYPDAFKRMGVRPPRGILLYGAPGTGKTLLAKAVAHESKANFILVKGPELLSKWVGESEKAVREIFKKARQTAPTIIFFDEIDSLASRRDAGSDSHVNERVVNQMLTEMDGLEELNDVIVIAATNRPDLVDTALLRPGRFDRIILTPVPEAATRKKIFEVHTKGMPVKSIDLDKLAEDTEGYVGADVEAVCREAAMIALRKDMKAKEITMKDFQAAMKEIGPSSTADVEKAYEELKGQIRAARGKEMKENKPSYFG
jgi:transitional endoplasmic reticulum ATPase